MDNNRRSSADTIPPGHVGNLSTDQINALARMWIRVLKYLSDPENPCFTPQQGTHKRESSFASLSKLFSSSNSNPNSGANSNASSGAGSEASLNAPFTHNDVAVLVEQMNDLDLNDDDNGSDALENGEAGKRPVTAKEMVREFWGLVHEDNPDRVLLRFLRARKWKVERAFAMLTDTLKWRLEWNVKKSVEKGEFGLNTDALLPPGKSYFRNTDKQGRPVW